MKTESGSLKKDYFWNTVGSGIYALFSMVLAFAAMHIAGPDDGGIFGFGFSAFGQQMFIIAYFGIRPFHITDAAHEYSYGEYRRLRQFTALAAVTAALVWLLFMHAAGSYSLRKSAIIFLLAFYKIADGIGDLYESECQRTGMLWLGGQELSCRTCLAAGVLIAALLLTGDVLTAAAAAVLAQAAYLLWFRQRMQLRLQGLLQYEIGGGRVRALFAGTVLLFLSVFVDFYVFSASKYAIDLHLTDADSGIFNILFMPTSVIYLAANFIIRPYMTRLSEAHEAGDAAAFGSIEKKLLTAVLVLSALAMAGTLLLGRPVLAVLERLLGGAYRGELTSRSGLFALVILGGCFYAVTNLYYYILVILRQQKRIFVNYLIAAVLAILLANTAVPRFGLMGAAAVYPLYMGATTLLFMTSAIRTRSVK